MNTSPIPTLWHQAGFIKKVKNQLFFPVFLKKLPFIRPDVDLNHIFPLHKCTCKNALMKRDVLPLDYRVNNHHKQARNLLCQSFIHLI